MTVLVGVDVATADVRAVAVSPEGDVVASAERPLPAASRPRPQWSQQRPAYAEVACDTLAALTGTLRGRPVAALSVTSTSGSVVPCDEGGAAVGDALLYDDRRAAGLPYETWADRGAPALGRIAWLARNRPASRYQHASDVVLAALAGRAVATDTSHALKTGADPERRVWPRGLLEAAGVDDGQLPRLAVPGTVVGEVDARAASRTGLRPGTPLALGMTDGCTGQIAAGAVRAGEGVGVLGTTLVLKAVARHRVEALGGAVYSHRAPDGTWWPGGASNVGAGILAAEHPDSDLAALDAAAGEHGPSRAVRYPLPRRGERFPFARPDAAGFWTRQPAGDVDAYRATLEGVAFCERLGFTVLARCGAPTSGPVRAVGAASRSPVWQRIRATVLGRPLWVARNPTSAVGAAVLAAAASVHDGLGSAVAAMVRASRTVDPDPDEAPRLERAYGEFVAGLVERGWIGDDLRGDPRGDLRDDPRDEVRDDPRDEVRNRRGERS